MKRPALKVGEQGPGVDLEASEEGVATGRLLLHPTPDRGRLPPESVDGVRPVAGDVHLTVSE